MSPKNPLLLAPVVAALAVAGCGGDDNNDKVSASTSTTATPAKTTAAPATGGAAETVKLSADPSMIGFNTKKLTAKAGKVTLSMANPSSIPHAIAIEGNGVDQDGNTVTKGGTSTVTADLKPGSYTFYCPVDDHEKEGMKGTLTVR